MIPAAISDLAFAGDVRVLAAGEPTLRGSAKGGNDSTGGWSDPATSFVP